MLKPVKETEVVVAIAKAIGFMIFSDDPKNSQAGISEDELEAVAGVYTLPLLCNTTECKR